jgi:hypothetical protein
MNGKRMTFFAANEYELFLIALGVEEQLDGDYFSALYLPAFGLPVYASVQLSSPCRVDLRIPIDAWDYPEALDTFEFYWDTQGSLSERFSSGILRDFCLLDRSDFDDYCDPNTRDGFAAYCKGTFEGKSFCFFTQNPGRKSTGTHIQYLMLIRKALFKLFPNVMALESMRRGF